MTARAFALSLAPLLCASFAGTDRALFIREETQWRSERLARLTAEDGWLTLTGLHWLDPGKNNVRLPKGRGGTESVLFVLDGKGVRVRPHADFSVLLNGEPVGKEEAVATDESGKPDLVAAGEIKLTVIKRGDRLAVRVRDPQSPARLAFKGLDYYEPSPEYVVEGRFVPYAKPKKVRVPTVIDTVEVMTSPGRVAFTLGGKQLELEPVLEDAEGKDLFYIFRDATSGKETYPAGRFLYSGPPSGGKVTLNFNRAYNPPCAFTNFATCPLPPKQNWLPVRIEAGEKNYRGAH